MNNSCEHLNAYPSLDHAAQGGWYCADCKRGVHRPARFSPPPGKQLAPAAPPPLKGNTPFQAPLFVRQKVSASNENTALAETFPKDPPPPPSPSVNILGIDDEPSEIVRKYSASESGGLVEWQGLYRYPSKGKKYYRYMAGKGDRIVIQLHIPGGSCSSPRSTGRADQVKRWINQGVRAETIAQYIRKWQTN